MNFYSISELQTMYPTLSEEEIVKRARIARDTIDNFLGACCIPLKCCCGTYEGVWDDTVLPLGGAFSYWKIANDTTINGILYPKDKYIVQTTDYVLGQFDYQVIDSVNCGVCIKPQNIDIAFLLAFEEAGTTGSCCDFRSFSFGNMSISTKDEGSKSSSAYEVWKELLYPYRCLKGYKL